MLSIIFWYASVFAAIVGSVSIITLEAPLLTKWLNRKENTLSEANFAIFLWEYLYSVS